MPVDPGRRVGHQAALGLVRRAHRQRLLGARGRAQKPAPCAIRFGRGGHGPARGRGWPVRRPAPGARVRSAVGCHLLASAITLALTIALGITATFASAITSVLACHARLPAKPGPHVRVIRLKPRPRPGPFRIDLYRPGDFMHQQTKDWCVAGSTQTMMNIIERGRPNRSRGLPGAPLPPGSAALAEQAQAGPHRRRPRRLGRAAEQGWLRALRRGRRRDPTGGHPARPPGRCA